MAALFTPDINLDFAGYEASRRARFAGAGLDWMDHADNIKVPGR